MTLCCGKATSVQAPRFEFFAQAVALLASATSRHAVLLWRGNDKSPAAWRKCANVQGVATLRGYSDGNVNCVCHDSSNP